MTAGSKLGRYRHIRTLGSGGAATVDLAEDTTLGRRVALKRVHTTDDDRGVSRLRREALVGASLSHPNLVSVFDVVTSDDGEPTIVMEYVEGETLRHALARGARIEVPRALEIVDGLAAALDAIHGRGIVHRDVKPANILLGDDGSIKLADLGIAAVSDRTRITTDGAVLGTFAYMAPEQLGSESPTPAVDVYALSAVAFEMLGGRKARTEDNPLALAHAISTRPPPDLRDVWPEAPPDAAEVLIRGMSADPARRPRSATELARRLRAAFEPVTTREAPIPFAARRAMRPAPAAAPVASSPREPIRPPATTAGPPGTGRRRAGVLAAALGALAAAIVAVILVNSGGSSSPTSGTGTSRQASAGTHNSATSNSTATRSKTHSPASSGASAPTSPSAPSTASTPATSAPLSSSAASGSSNGTPATGAGSPTSAVETFYNLAASHRYPDAWAIADPSFRSQLGGYGGFQGTMAATRSITFNSARVVNQTAAAATVVLATTSVRSDGTKHCTGTVDLVRGGTSAGWMLHRININCS